MGCFRLPVRGFHGRLTGFALIRKEEREQQGRKSHRTECYNDDSVNELVTLQGTIGRLYRDPINQQPAYVLRNSGVLGDLDGVIGSSAATGESENGHRVSSSWSLMAVIMSITQAPFERSNVTGVLTRACLVPRSVVIALR